MTAAAGARRIAVIGGGLSGLAAAHRLTELAAQPGAAPLSITLFEASGKLGGTIGTERIGEYLVERGADSFITNKPWAAALCKRLGLEDRLIPIKPGYRRSLVLSRGKPVPVPDGFLLMAPAKIGPVLSTPILSAAGKARLAFEYFVPRRKENCDESVASFVRRRFGNELFERIVQPLIGGIYTADPEKLSLRATMPRFLEWEQKYGSLIRAARREQQQRNAQSGETSGARYGMFATLAGGLSELIDAMTTRIANAADIRMNTRVSSIVPATDRQGFDLTTASGASGHFDAVVLAVPAYAAAGFVRGFASQLAAELNAIEYASSAIVVSGHRQAEIQHPLDAAGLVIPAIEERRILAVSFASCKFPGRAPEGHVLLRTFVGGALQPELLSLSDGGLRALVRDELADILGATGREDFGIVARYERVMPQYHVGHLDRIAGIVSRLSIHPNLAIAGNYLNGVGIPDCIHSGEQAAERITTYQ